MIFLNKNVDNNAKVSKKRFMRQATDKMKKQSDFAGLFFTSYWQVKSRSNSVDSSSGGNPSSQSHGTTSILPLILPELLSPSNDNAESKDELISSGVTESKGNRSRQSSIKDQDFASSSKNLLAYNEDAAKTLTTKTDIETNKSFISTLMQTSKNTFKQRSGRVEPLSS